MTSTSGLEAMIFYRRGLYPSPNQHSGPSFIGVLKEIRRQHKELANVQRKENSEAGIQPATQIERINAPNWRTRTFSRNLRHRGLLKEISPPFRK